MILYFIISGILQGIFEWLPVSSEGILTLFNNYVLKEASPLDLALFLHLGTLLAVLFYFRKDFKDILLLKDKKLFWFLFLSTSVSLLIAFPLYKLASQVILGGWVLLLTGFGLLLTAWLQKIKAKSSLPFLSNKLALLAGFLQGFSVMPGVSRSGTTIFALSLGEKKDPQSILKLSYLMSAPIVLSSTLFLLLKGKVVFDIQVLLSLALAFIFGLLFLKILLKLAARINFFKFALFFALLCFLASLIEFLI